MTFGGRIGEARKKANLSQKELADRIRKENGEPISPQYLNDIERNRRNPPSIFMIDQFAEVLEIEKDVLYFLAGKLPEKPDAVKANEKQIIAAYKAFRRELNRSSQEK